MERKSLKKKYFFPVLAIMLVFFGSSGRSYADKASNVDREIQREKNTLKKIETEIERKKKRAAESRKKERSLLSVIEGIDRRFSLLRKEAASLELEIQKKEKEEHALSSRIDEVTLEIERARKIILERIESIYKERQGASLKILFASQDYPDLLRKLQYLKTIARREDEILSLFKESHAELEEKQDRLNSVVKRMLADRETLARKLIERRTERKRKKRLLTRIQKDRKLFKISISEMIQSSQKVKRLISGMEKRKKQIRTILPGKFSTARGHLRWPNNGRIAALFGRQKHPRFDEMIFRKGIEIAPSGGGEVRTVFDGTVVYADWFRGYGMMVMIDHGENYYSLYAHMAKLLVGVGDRVSKGRTLGEVGETGLSNGSKLYFEIRHRGQPINPLSWLQKRR